MDNPCLILTHGRRNEEAGHVSPEQLSVVEEEAAEEVEPSWELAEELREYRGEPDDRKSMLAFRQKQQSARQVRCLPLFEHRIHTFPALPHVRATES